MIESTRVRVSIIGVIVLALFSALVARLWYLQIAGSTNLASAATANSVRVVPQDPLRGRILDDKGRVLVDNRSTTEITVDRTIDPKTRSVVVGRLAEELGVPVATIQKRLDDLRVSPYKPVPVATDVPIEVLTFIKEHQQDFPGVSEQTVAVRRYVNGPLMAHVLGYTGEINDAELKRLRSAGYGLGEDIGKAGVEETYESDLRGQPGSQRLEVDSRGHVVRTLGTNAPQPGHDVQLTLDLDAQKLAEDSLAQGIAAAQQVQDTSTKDRYQNLPAPAGTVVVLNADDGSVVAMASNPTYDPNQFVNGIPSALYQQYNDPSSYYPLLNRAIQGQYAPGSTFKLVTALAGLSSGQISTGSTIEDTGCLDLKVEGGKFCNDGNASYGTISLQRAITVSSDMFFYEIGDHLWQSFHHADPSGDAIQNEARALDFGKPTGVALPGEAKGRVPDQAWKTLAHQQNPAAFPYAQWEPGDNIHLAVGQGDLVVTPLQLANAYATFADGGTVHQPRVAESVLDETTGAKVRDIPPVATRSVPIDPQWRGTMMAGFQGAVSDSKGTAAGAFAGSPVQQLVAGKTGTAQVAGKAPTSVFVAMTPVDHPHYIVLTMVEQGNYGAETAAPITRRILEGLNGLPLTPITITAPPTQGN